MKIVDKFNPLIVDMKRLNEQIKLIDRISNDLVEGKNKRNLEGIYELLCCLEEQLKDNNGIAAIRPKENQ